MRILPSNNELGWTPFAWLVYLAFFLVDPILNHRPWQVNLATGAATAVFLVLYFVGFWQKGRRLLLVVVGITLLGVLCAPLNPGASVFFIYAAAFVPFAGDAGFAVKTLLAILATIGLEAAFLHLVPGFWIPAIVISSLVGGVNIHYAQQRCANARLRRAHDEIEHLAKVAERERIARDMHDVLGHTLSVVILKSELAAKLIDRNPEQAKVEISEVEKISRDALAEVRNAIGGYRSNGVGDELARAKATLETAGLEVKSSIAEVKLTPPQETVLSLALREAVTNVVRHARARNCQLELAQNNGNCVLQIEDDGRGGYQPEGNGLRGMRERVEALGGRLSRETSRGTKLTILLPLAKETTHS